MHAIKKIALLFLLFGGLLLSGCFGGGDSGTSSAQLSVTSSNAYLPTSGISTITVRNNSTTLIATNISVSGLPTDSTVFAEVNNCVSIAPLGTCTITLISDEATANSSSTLTIAGTNTTTATVTLTIDPTNLTVSSQTFTGPGAINFTVTNPNHFTVALSSVTLSTGSGVTITSNTCTSTLAALGSCTVTITATAQPALSAQTLTATGTITTHMTSDLSVAVTGQGDVALNPPSASVNGGNDLLVEIAAGASTTTTISVASGSFDLVNPSRTLSISPNASGTNFSLSGCTSTMSAGSSCTLTITNTTALTPVQGTLSLSADRFTTQVINANVQQSVGFDVEPLGSAYYVSAINGPRYKAILVRNFSNQSASFTTLTPTLPSSITVDTTSSDHGVYQQCTQGMTLTAYGSATDQCLYILTGAATTPNTATATGTVAMTATLSGSGQTFSKTINLSNNTYLYVSSAAPQIGSATTTDANLLAKCRLNNCTNFFGSSSTLGANGSSITAMALDSPGNLYVGGSFTAIGTASGSNVLLAKCYEGACYNALNSSGVANSTISTLATNGTTVYAAGFFTALGSASASGGRQLIAQCTAGVCSNVSSTSSDGANDNITKLVFSGTTLYAVGAFTQFGSVSSASGPLILQCQSGACSNYLGGTTGIGGSTIDSLAVDSGGVLYLAGLLPASGGGYRLLGCSAGSCQDLQSNAHTTFIFTLFYATPTASGAYAANVYTYGTVTTSSAFMYLNCTPSGSTFSCTNLLSGTSGADNVALTIANDSAGQNYLMGNFRTFGAAASGNSNFPVASCNATGTCSNFLQGTTPNGATEGSDYQASAVGNELSAS